MANPVITDIVVEPDPFVTGGTGTITILASDPDAAPVTIDITVTDSRGGVSTHTVLHEVADPLTYQVTVDRGTVTQDPSNPAVWHWADA